MGMMIMDHTKANSTYRLVMGGLRPGTFPVFVQKETNAVEKWAHEGRAQVSVAHVARFMCRLGEDEAGKGDSGA